MLRVARERVCSPGLGGADGNSERPCFRRCNDVALSVKNPARLDHQTKRVDLPGGDSFVVNLYSSFCEDYPVEMA